MNRQKYICSLLSLFFLGSTLLASCGKNDINVIDSLNDELTIFPDYKDVTIPVNIAPLNFSMMDSAMYCLILKGKESQFQVRSRKGLFSIPQRKWKALLSENAGGEIELTVAKQMKNGWNAYKPFHIEVSRDSISPYLAYRLLALSNDMWNKMGIYQRDMESYEQSAIYENSLTDYNCVNCHTFPLRNPNTIFFHMRGNINGSVLVKGNEVTKLITKTPKTISNFSYIYWHPSGDYLATTICQTYQNFFVNNPNTLEVQDDNSDIYIYDVRKNEIFSCEALNSKDAWQIYPTFSPDGKSLYFCTTPAVDAVAKNYRLTNYSLCRISFDAETGTFGQKVDTLYNGRENHKSVSFPRVSPDGKYLAFTLQAYGAFGVWHKDADLYMVRLSDGKVYPLTEANSEEEADSYHSWSGNSHWLAFSSRRIDGLYTRTFFTYIDDDGQSHKPFLLPQKNPKKFYQDLLFAFNVPDFIDGKVNLDKRAIMKVMRETKGTQVQVR